MRDLVPPRRCLAKTAQPSGKTTNFGETPMITRLIITALTLSLPLATGACAVSGMDGAYAYRSSPPSSNPHDVFRTVTRTPMAADAHAADASAVERPR